MVVKIVRKSKELEKLRSYYEQGNVIPALYDAIQIIKKEGPEAYGWALAGASSIIEAVLKLSSKQFQNDNIKKITKYRTTMKHYRRWQAVKHYKDKDLTWAQSYRAAQQALKNTFAKGASETMRKSYQRVEKDTKHREKSLEYYDASRDAHSLTGTPAVKLT